MPLSDIIDRAIELNTIAGKTKQPEACNSALWFLRRDPGARDEALYLAVNKSIHDRCTRAIRPTKNVPGQLSFFGLHQRYSLDDDDRIIKNTELLTRLEFQKILNRKRKQLKDDKKHLDVLEAANKQLDPIWTEYPDKLFGEVERIYLNQRPQENTAA